MILNKGEIAYIIGSFVEDEEMPIRYLRNMGIDGEKLADISDEHMSMELDYDYNRDDFQDDLIKKLYAMLEREMEIEDMELD